MYERTIEKAQKANEAFSDVTKGWGVEKVKYFKSYYHFYTTDNHYKIVSTLPNNPMQICFETTSIDSFTKKIHELNAYLEEHSAALESHKLNFDPNEDYINASFIRDMVLKPEKYNGIIFVLSRFGLWSGGYAKGADTLCYKDGILYLIEIRRGRTTNLIEQTIRFKVFLEDKKYSDIYVEIFSKYTSLETYTVCPVVLVPKRKNEAEPTFESKCEDSNILIWTYEAINGEINFIPMGI